MPNEVELREVVYNWLVQFDMSENYFVLDEVGLIQNEYDRNLPYNWQEQEYGLRVLQSKVDRMHVVYVPIEAIEGNGEHIALLQPEHEVLVNDREDRKWVACAFATNILYEQTPPIVYGAETDWYLSENALSAIGLGFIRLLPKEWYESRV